MTTPTPDELARLARGDCINKAKRLLREQLAIHRDEGVRALNAVAELADDNPAVVRIAAALSATLDPAAIVGGQSNG